ncbi:MAG TPA: cation diffusion facilitator family transporter [Bryobacteraceae bacterium]|nr:cation diffusion facilitator family transporter [Bryobacteraceae bacterium]
MHSHAHGSPSIRVLKWSLAATVLFVVVELLAGVQAHSLALISDAGHNFTDALALLLAWFGLYLQSKPADDVKTYGYHRAGVLAAFVNALALVGLSLYIFYESYHRLVAPRPVDESTMFVVAGLGLVLNAAIMWAMRHDQRHDLNIRTAYLHMLGDALGSVGILIGAVVIRFTGWQLVDPVLSILIGGLIIWTAWDVIREALNILLEGLPRGMDLRSVIASMRQVDGVLDVHDLHIWSLGSRTHALSCHVLIADLPPSESDAILRRLNATLSGRYQIEHTTVQFEHVSCAVSENGCPVSPPQSGPVICLGAPPRSPRPG